MYKTWFQVNPLIHVPQPLYKPYYASTIHHPLVGIFKASLKVYYDLIQNREQGYTSFKDVGSQKSL